ncbi:MAG: IS630 family transposase, partial [Caulobacteraceae bacterium]
MAQTVSLPVSAEDRVRLAEIVDDRGRLLKNIQRVGIILFSAE